MAARLTLMRARDDDVPRLLGERLFAAAPGGTFEQIDDRVGPPPGLGLSLAVIGDDVLTVDQRRLSGPVRVFQRTAGGDPVELALPAGASGRALGVGGDLVALPILADADDEGSDAIAVAVLDRRTGRELRRVAIEGELVDEVEQVAVSPDGALAFVEDGTLAYAAPGAARFAEVETPPLSGDVFVPASGGRIAVALEANDPMGIAWRQVLLLEPPAGAGRPAVLFRGPPTADVDALAFDGAHVAWAGATCNVLAEVGDPALPALPAGPCRRTEVELAFLRRPVRPGTSRYRFRVACVATPRPPCRFRAIVEPGRRRVGSAARTVALGRFRTVSISIPARLARHPARLSPRVRIVEDGRARLVGPS